MLFSERVTVALSAGSSSSRGTWAKTVLRGVYMFAGGWVSCGMSRWSSYRGMELGNGRGRQPLFTQLERLQGDLHVNKLQQYICRLMVACVGKAVEGGIGRLRELLEVPVEASSSGQLTQGQNFV